MNLFTHYLAQPLRHRALRRFIAGWDTLESLIIHTYKAGQVDPADSVAHGQVRQQLLRAYPRWQGRLAPFWRAALVGGVPCPSDPFERLLAPAALADFVDDWTAMQHLPAAREALNRLVLALTGDGPDAST